jgi:hypothetical protein
MNSKQGSRYIKKRMGNDLKNKILEYNGICVDPYVRNKIIVLEFNYYIICNVKSNYEANLIYLLC